MEDIDNVEAGFIPLNVKKTFGSQLANRTFTTKELEALADKLGVSGKCVFNIINVLETYAKEQTGTASKKQIKEKIAIALSDPLVNQRVQSNRTRRHCISSASLKGNRFLLIILILLILVFGTVLVIRVFSIKNCEGLVREKPERKNTYDALVTLNRSIEKFAVMKEENEIWYCGGISKNINQSQICEILNLNDGKTKPFKLMLKLPRINSVMFFEGRSVKVMSGETSDLKSSTGCRATEEILNRDNPDAGWTLHEIEDNTLCKTARQFRNSNLNNYLHLLAAK